MIVTQNEPWRHVLVLLTSKDAIKTKRPDAKQITQCTDQTPWPNFETNRNFIDRF